MIVEPLFLISEFVEHVFLLVIFGVANVEFLMLIFSKNLHWSDILAPGRTLSLQRMHVRAVATVSSAAALSVVALVVRYFVDGHSVLLALSMSVLLAGSLFILWRFARLAGGVLVPLVYVLALVYAVDITLSVFGVADGVVSVRMMHAGIHFAEGILFYWFVISAFIVTAGMVTYTRGESISV